MYTNKNFSLFALFTAGLASLARADDGPTANAIYLPGLNDIVPAGQPYDITWNPTSPYSGGTVTLVLLKGPSSNCEPIQTIAASIENSGSYSWTPDTSLEDSCDEGYGCDAGYGIELYIDSNSAYQYSTQFGISNDASSSSSSSSSAAASATTSASSTPGVSKVSITTTIPLTITTSLTPSSTPVSSTEAVTTPLTTPELNTTTPAFTPLSTPTPSSTPISSSTFSTPTPKVLSTGGMPPSSEIVTPTVRMSVPNTLQTSAASTISVAVEGVTSGVLAGTSVYASSTAASATSTPLSFTGGAAREVGVGAFGAVAVAAVAAMLV